MTNPCPEVVSRKYDDGDAMEVKRVGQSVVETLPMSRAKDQGQGAQHVQAGVLVDEQAGESGSAVRRTEGEFAKSLGGSQAFERIVATKRF